MYSRDENNAQKYSSDKNFTDENKKTGKERTINGSEVDNGES